jgi:hypothetical protein
MEALMTLFRLRFQISTESQPLCQPANAAKLAKTGDFAAASRAKLIQHAPEASGYVTWLMFAEWKMKTTVTRDE